MKIRGHRRYLYRDIDKYGNPVDFLLTAKRDLDAAKRFFRKMLKDEPLLSPKKIGTDGANTARRTIAGFEAMVWLRKGFGFSGSWTVKDQNDLLARLFGPQKVNRT